MAEIRGPTGTSEEGEEVQPLSPTNIESLDQRILKLLAKYPVNESNCHVIRPAYLASQLGLSLDDATSELCGLMSAVGGGDGNASFVFERVEIPETSASSDTSAMTMVFTFPSDFEGRALSYQRKMNWYQRLVNVSAVIVKAVKIFTAFGLIFSLLVIIIVGVCLLVAGVIAMARGGGRNQNHHQILMHKLRFLLLQLRQILWLYAICGGGGQDDPFMREIAGDLALILSCCVGSPMNMFFLMRMGGGRRRGGGLYNLSQRRGWGSPTWRSRNWRRNHDVDEDGVAMIRRGSWGNNQNTEEDRPNRSNSSSSFGSQTSQQQRGLLSVAVEFLFGPSDSDDEIANSSSYELEKWKFRGAMIMALSAASEGKGVSLRELLPYTDNPPASIDDASTLRETMKLITYFNGKPANRVSSELSGGIDAYFFFPEIMAETETDIYALSQRIMSLGSSEFAPPPNTTSESNIIGLLYKNDEDNETDFEVPEGTVPKYFYERRKFLTHLSRKQFNQCLFLGFLNFIGIISVQGALMPGGIFELSISTAMAIDADMSGATTSRRRKQFNFWIWLAPTILKLLKVLRFYSIIFFLLPLVRLVILMIQNYFIDKRNQRRLHFVTE